MNVLVVEDNPGDQRLIERGLRRASSALMLHIVDDGIKALQFMRNEGEFTRAPRPDFVLLDLKLPRKSGVDVLRDMKCDRQLRAIPVIVLTSSEAPSDVELAYSAQANAYIAKPVADYDTLMGRICAFMDLVQIACDEGDAGPVRPAESVAELAPALAGGPRGMLAHAHAIVESAADAILSKSRDGRILSWNPASERLYGYRAAEAIGQNVFRLIVPENSAEGLRMQMEAVWQGAWVTGFETWRVDRHGRSHVVALSMSPVRDAAGDIVAICAIARDITEQKQAEERFRLAVESSPSAMVMADHTGIIVMVNAETERLFGYGRDELVGEPVDRLVPERFRGQHPAHRAEFLAKPEARAMGGGRDLYAVRRDGSEFPVEIGLNPIQTPDGMFVLSAIVDITERKLAEEELARQTRELERSNAELEQFAYVASHDLQEPLRMVASFTRLLKLEYEDQLDSTAREYVEFAVDGAIRMQQMIKDLLTYARLSTGREPFESIALSEVVARAMRDLDVAIRESEATIRVGELPALVGIDRLLVELFQNLIANGIKFHRDAPPEVDIGARRDGAGWLCSVSDNGIGIDASHSDEVFQMFRRLHAVGDYPGTGIGLALCRRIVERHMGRVWIDSAKGAGTTVHIWLPDDPRSMRASR